MKKIFSFGIPIATLIFLATLAGSCSASNGPGDSSVIDDSPEATQVSYDMSSVITERNRSYIPINIAGKPSDDPSSMLRIVNAFEDAHPELEIVRWWIEKRQAAYTTSSRIYGIWVDHKPRE